MNYTVSLDTENRFSLSSQKKSIVTIIGYWKFIFIFSGRHPGF